MYLRLPTSFAVIYGSFTLGLYVAIQGPTLMDLIDLLHVNNYMMSYTLAFASLAYAVGGLLSGLLFEYVNRQLLIAAYFLIFGIANIVTPFITNYMVFSVITVFKMVCAGGTDCGANVWILEMWPGQDSWLQALHFTFAVGCALGPLIVEPFLSVDEKEKSGADSIEKMHGITSGQASISDQANETRIHVPYGVSGLACILACVWILVLYYLQERHKRLNEKLRLKQQAAAGETILLTAIQHPAAMEAGDAALGASAGACCHERAADEAGKQAEANALSESAKFLPQAAADGRQLVASPVSSTTTQTTTVAAGSDQQQQSEQQQPLLPALGPAAAAINHQSQEQQTIDKLVTHQQAPSQQQPVVKITSKARESVGRPPCYVMFAVALAAMCLSFYCGIEITSMNYLATFAVNIDLQLPKSTAALMSSALTISFAVGRGIAVYMAAIMKPHILFYLCVSVMATGNILILIFANTAETLLWYSICIFGVGCGPMFPSIVSFFDDKISKVTNTVSGIFILGSMFNVALNSLIIGHHIIDNALILIVCNLIGSVVLLLLFGTLHMLTLVKRHQRVKKFRLKQQVAVTNTSTNTNTNNNNDNTTNATANANNDVTTSLNNIIISTAALQQTTNAPTNNNSTSSSSNNNNNNNNSNNSPIEEAAIATTTIGSGS